MPRWVMVVDLRRCNGCQCCVANCSQTNHLPLDAVWRRVAQSEQPDAVVPRRVFLPFNCMHCANPPCMDVCPTAATYQRTDGIVDIDLGRCMGCGYCVVACPYLARTISPSGKAAYVGVPAQALSDGQAELREGTCTKCNLCLPKIEQGQAKGLIPGIDPEATPTCAISCLPHAIHFGDRDDPKSEVSQLIQANETRRVGEELGTDPSIYYIVD